MQCLKEMISCIFGLFVVVSSRSICLRPSNPESVYETLPDGESLARLLRKVSSESTSNLMLQLLSSPKGHDALRCSQEEWDVMEKEYNQCVHIVMHQLRCGGYGGPCQWINAFVETCTGQIMSKCWAEEEARQLPIKQMEMLEKNELLRKCKDSDQENSIELFMQHLKNPAFLSKSKENKSSFRSQLLRLG